jgi:hypothetical protein
MRLLALFVLTLAGYAGTGHAAEPLGRLFFTPAQRNALDAGKQLDRPKQAGPAVRGPRSVTVNGIVTRSDGESTVWVNGAPAGASGRGAAPVVATPSGTASARVRVLDSNARLRVGQTLDRRTGKISEAYENRRATSAPAVPAPPSPASGAEAGSSIGSAADGSDDATEN